MYKKPSQRRIKKDKEVLNLVPILDAVFILIFYLLMSAQFFKTYEIGNDYPLSSTKPPPKEKKETLDLVLVLNEKEMKVQTGKDEKVVKTLSYGGQSYLDELNKLLISLQGRFPEEKSVIINPNPKIKYKVLVNILDYVRNKYDQEGRSTPLFTEIVFGNIDEE